MEMTIDNRSFVWTDTVAFRFHRHPWLKVSFWIMPEWC